MKQPALTLVLLLLMVIAGASLSAAEPTRALDLHARQVFSTGPNVFAGDVLEITKGRGAIIGWYVQAKQEEEITVSIDYACEKPLDQDYQLSFGGQDTFWQVPVTKNDEWGLAKIGSFRVRAGQPVLVLLVPPSNRKYDHPLRFRKLVLAGRIEGNLSLAQLPKEPAAPDASPGFGQKLTSLHPALALEDLRDEALTLRISGMALRSPNELIFTTWDGDLYSFDLSRFSGAGSIKFRRIAQGLSEPMGLAVSNGRIFVTEKNEVTELLDEDGDGAFETYRCVSHAWPCTMDYHEYLFGAVVKDSQLYFSSSVGMATRDKDNRQAPLRGSVIKVHVDTGKTEIVAGGLRTPDGIGEGPKGSLLVTDNQGEWLPANKLISVQQDAFYQFRSREPWHPLDRPQATPPAVWLPQGEIANSPTEPILLPATWGPYAGQVVFGDATYGGLQRAFVEDVEGITQGAVFHFSQGFRHLFHRFALTASGDLYAGGIARGADREFIHRVSGLSRIRYTGKTTFEPLAARLRSNGLEVEFTLPLAPGSGWDPAGYYVTRWSYQGTQTYGGAKVLHRRAQVDSATVSQDRRRVFLEIADVSPGEVLHVRIPESLPSASGVSLWSGEFWYTVNRVPRSQPGIVAAAPPDVLRPAVPYFSFSKDNEGRVLYRNYCAACHSLDGLKLVGPTFAGLAGSNRKVRDASTGKLHAVLADATYLKRSILEPNSQLADGYPVNLMPPVGATLTEKQLGELIKYITKASDPEFARKEVTQQRPLNLAWTLNDFPEVGTRLPPAHSEPRVLAQGMQAFTKAQCLQCHAVSGIGATVGPNLAESIKKYQGQKLLQQILEPAIEIHPKYQTRQFLLENGQVEIGVVLKEDEHAFHIAKNLLTPQALTRIEKSSVEEQGVSQVSAMPNGLLNSLTKTEILDMLRFLEAGPAPMIPGVQPTPSK